MFSDSRKIWVRDQIVCINIAASNGVYVVQIGLCGKKYLGGTHETAEAAIDEVAYILGGPSELFGPWLIEWVQDQ
jgi:hypothetical protein